MVCSPVRCEGSGRCANSTKGSGQASLRSVSRVAGFDEVHTQWGMRVYMCVCVCVRARDSVRDSVRACVRACRGSCAVCKLGVWCGGAPTMCAA